MGMTVMSKSGASFAAWSPTMAGVVEHNGSKCVVGRFGVVIVSSGTCIWALQLP